MTDFILAPKATHRAKDIDMEKKKNMIWMYIKICNEMASEYFKSQKF